MRLNFATAAAAPRADGDTQDRLVVHRLPGVLIADGAGGITGGDVAADAVVRGVAEGLVDDAGAFLKAEGVVALLRRIDDDVERLPAAGETTAVLVVLMEDGLYGASCGDSVA
jgi:serine/threonine protein phosphatase PrpC